VDKIGRRWSTHLNGRSFGLKRDQVVLIQKKRNHPQASNLRRSEVRLSAGWTTCLSSRWVMPPSRLLSYCWPAPLRESASERSPVCAELLRLIAREARRSPTGFGDGEERWSEFPTFGPCARAPRQKAVALSFISPAARLSRPRTRSLALARLDRRPGCRAWGSGCAGRPGASSRWRQGSNATGRCR
jgi:hypothetical protein